MEFLLPGKNGSAIFRILKRRSQQWAGHAGRIGKGTNAYRILLATSLGKYLLESLKRTWEYFMKADLRKADCKYVSWMEVTQ
jgi:hypothetical protein